MHNIIVLSVAIMKCNRVKQYEISFVSLLLSIVNYLAGDVLYFTGMLIIIVIVCELFIKKIVLIATSRQLMSS